MNVISSFASVGIILSFTLALLSSPITSATSITFNLNGVAPDVHVESTTGSSSVTIPSTIVDFDNMTFLGWNTKPDGSGIDYETGQTLTSDLTLYAQWGDGTHIDDPSPSPTPDNNNTNSNTNGNSSNTNTNSNGSNSNSSSNGSSSNSSGSSSGSSSSSNSSNSSSSSSNSSSSNTSTGSPSAGYATLPSKLTMPISFILAGILAIVAALKLTRKEANSSPQPLRWLRHLSLLSGRGNNVKSSPERGGRGAKHLGGVAKARPVVLTLATLSIVLGSLYTYTTITNATTTYNGFFTVNQCTSWWKGGEKQYGSTTRNNVNYYFDKDNEGCAAKDTWVKIGIAEYSHYDTYGKLDNTSTTNQLTDDAKVIDSGLYIITKTVENSSSSSTTTLALDIAAASLDDSANVRLWNSNNTIAQRFYFEYLGDGYYTIANLATGKVLDVDSGKTDNGTNVQQYTRNSSNSQKWLAKQNSNGTYTFISKVGTNSDGKDLALDIENGTLESGSNIQIYAANDSTAQQFTLTKVEGNWLPDNAIVAIHSYLDTTKVLDMENGSSANNTQLQLYEDNDTTFGQRFQLEKLTDDDNTTIATKDTSTDTSTTSTPTNFVSTANSYRIRTAASGGYLTEVPSSTTGYSKGDLVKQQGSSTTKVSGANTWELVWIEGTGLAFRNAASNNLLDVSSSSTANGTKLQVWTRNKAKAQGFAIEGANLVESNWYNITLPSEACLDIAGAGTTEGTNVEVYTCNDTMAQAFKVTYPEGNGKAKLAASSQLVLDVKNGSSKDGTNVQMWSNNDNDAQRWTFAILDGGYLKVTNTASGTVLTAESSALGGNVAGYADEGLDTQKWHFAVASVILGWIQEGGNWRYYDKTTGELYVNRTAIVDDEDFAPIYDFDSEGNASWHLPVNGDGYVVEGSRTGSSETPFMAGDRRQRVLMAALSKIGTPYGTPNDPATHLVCDGLTDWAYETGTGEDYKYFSADYEYDLIKTRNGIITSDFQAGDLIFWGDEGVTWVGGLAGDPGYHAAMYYHDGYMIQSTSANGVHIATVDSYGMTPFWGGGSPYETETSRVSIHK